MTTDIRINPAAFGPRDALILRGFSLIHPGFRRTAR
jgi:hypothetical protein